MAKAMGRRVPLTIMHAHQLLGLAQSTDASVLRTLVRRAVLAQRVHVLAGVLRSVRRDRHVMGEKRGWLIGGVVVVVVWLMDGCGQVLILLGHEIVLVVVDGLQRLLQAKMMVV